MVFNRARENFALHSILTLKRQTKQNQKLSKPELHRARNANGIGNMTTVKSYSRHARVIVWAKSLPIYVRLVKFLFDSNEMCRFLHYT